MIITRTPLRISFFGGGTDFPEYYEKHGGAVLSAAINKYCYINVSEFPSQLFDYGIRISYSQSELVKDTSEIKHPVFRACLEHLNIRSDIELHAVADLPAFTGLGSSSSFTVGILHALHAFRGDRVTAAELAREAIHIERNILDESVGCQDQVAAAYGGFNLIEFTGESAPKVTHVPISLSNLLSLQEHLLLVFTNIKRRAHDIEKNKMANLDVARQEYHLLKEQVSQGMEILKTKGRLDIRAMGELLHEGWMRKRKLSSSVSTPLIDEYYERGIANGAIGGKLLGAGGGGFLMFMAPPERHQFIRDAFPGHHTMALELGSHGSEVIFNEKPRKSQL